MTDPAGEAELGGLLAEQQRYYRTLAPRYGHSAPVPASDEQAARLERELGEAMDACCRGEVLELACGPGTWTGMLAARARTLLALDGAPEMLERAAAAHGELPNVRFAPADLFAWEPDRRYDAVFFGFWLSHVPEPHFARFWERVSAALAPGGSVLFVDDAFRAEEEQVFGDGSSVVRRTLEDGTHHRIVKQAHTAAGLQRALAELGWSFSVRDVGPFYWGLGHRA